ncbi:MAG: hypothetical protein ACREEV_04765 [Dongiaceae bacterium]
MPISTPSLADIDAWFDKKILPQRTAWSGVSPSRIYKTPHRIFAGNQTDPDGLCGDATLFVFDSYDATFKTTIWTSDGYQLGAILWNGFVSNHMANVMLPKAAARLQTFVMAGAAPMLRSTYSLQQRASFVPKAKSAADLDGKDLLNLHVYDLYYKKRTTVGAWWEDLDKKKGELTVGLQADFT